MRIRRLPQLLVLLVLGFRTHQLTAQSLNVRLDGDQLKIGAPQLRLLTGDALQRLRDGASVTYVFETVITSGRNGDRLAQATFRFVFSYDLWEEKYAVTRVGSPPRSVSHLSAPGAEAWCLDLIRVPLAGISAQTPFWVSLEYRTEEPQRPADNGDNSGFTLGSLIDIFSRRTLKQEARGSRDAGPFRLADLRRGH